MDANKLKMWHHSEKDDIMKCFPVLPMLKKQRSCHFWNRLASIGTAVTARKRENMWKYIKKYLHFAIIAALFMVGEVLMDLLQPEIMSKIVDDGVLGINNHGS